MEKIKDATDFETTKAIVGRTTRAILGTCVVVGFDGIQVAIIAPNKVVVEKAFNKLLTSGVEMDADRLQSVAIFDQSTITKIKS